MASSLLGCLGRHGMQLENLGGLFRLCRVGKLSFRPGGLYTWVRCCGSPIRNPTRVSRLIAGFAAKRSDPWARALCRRGNQLCLCSNMEGRFPNLFIRDLLRRIELVRTLLFRESRLFLGTDDLSLSVRSGNGSAFVLLAAEHDRDVVCTCMLMVCKNAKPLPELPVLFCTGLVVLVSEPCTRGRSVHADGVSTRGRDPRALFEVERRD